MKYLLSELDNIKRLLTDKLIFLFLDYDGTLAPIAQKPAYAVIPKQTKDLLRELSKKPRCITAVISGRGITDIMHLVGLSDIIYGGNHGLELAGPGIRFNSPVSQKHRDTLIKINKVLRNKLRSIKGVLIENKGLSLSIHFRRVNDKNIPMVKNIFCEATAFNLWRNEIRVRLGKKVLEVFPPVNWDKGKAVLWLLHNMSFSESTPAFPIYIGDDVSDEDAFKMLKNSGLTILVGNQKKSDAQYYVNNTDEVVDFLTILLAKK
jgi:trehalose 6-phosphate phosphatase